MRIGIAFLSAFLLCACATESELPESYSVRDAAAAIAIAKKICRSNEESGEPWSAKLNGDIWQARHTYAKGYPGCNWEQALVRADNGSAPSCEVCVVAN